MTRLIWVKVLMAVAQNHGSIFNRARRSQSVQMQPRMAAVADQAASMRQLSAAELSVAPPIPKSVKVELHSRCNLGCGFCAAGRRPRASSTMDLRVFSRIARELGQFGVERLGLFYMNEPFADERLPDAIRIAKNDSGIPYVFLTSNGLEASPERLRACFEAGLDSLKFALNFAGPAQLGASCPDSTHAFHEILKNVREARRVRDEVRQDTGQYCRLSASSLAYDPEQCRRMRPVIEPIAGQVDEHYWLP
ncbi:MAG: radical SAM protein, partial [Betaproteobacteria bacterium]